MAIGIIKPDSPVFTLAVDGSIAGDPNVVGPATVAVVGVILNLGLVFGAAVIWPQGLAGGADWFAAVMSVLAFVALYRLKADVLWVVMAGGIIGLAKMFLR